jgi:hypothetical protein
MIRKTIKSQQILDFVRNLKFKTGSNDRRVMLEDIEPDIKVFIMKYAKPRNVK